MRKELYIDIIEDVAMEISLDNEWRKKIFNCSMESVLNISYKDALQLPEYIRDDIVNNKLEFCVKKVNECEEHFDEGLIIFMFWSKEYPDIVRYSGNNPDIIL